MTDLRCQPVPSPTLLMNRSGRAFTLPELIVAVAAVALLTVGIGQIFSSVGKLVGTGAAIAETDQFARAISHQMRTDFAALNNMRADETFVAIRNRKLGDTNGDGIISGSERAVYLTSDDRERDTRDAIDPYSAGSRAVTVRIDEIVFLAFAGQGGAFTTVQPPASPISVGGGALLSTPASQVARIYYGHGLRPAPDREFDIENPLDTGPNVPPRRWVPDGDYGQRAGDPNRFDPGSRVNGGRTSGRNEYAGSWLFLRQPLMLYGGLAAGFPPSPTYGANPGAPFGSNIVYTPYIRGLEAEPAPDGRGGYWGWNLVNSTEGPLPRTNPSGAPFARLMRHGRVDLCAQGPDEVRRWLEGMPDTFSASSSDVTAFEGGRLDYINTQAARWDLAFGDNAPNNKPDSPLWVRPFNGAGNPLNQIQTHSGIMSAIAGCFQRFQAESVPPLIDRGDTLDWDDVTGPSNQAANREPPEVAYMDLHSVIGSRVSNFEVAWSDGKTWNLDQPYDRDGDGVEDLFRGDEIWYDFEFSRFNNPSNNRDLPAADPAQTAGDDVETIRTNPEVHAGQRQTRLLINGNGHYNEFNTGADPTAQGDHEYLAIFPFRRADVSSEFSTSAYPKPKRIRVRMTVHDSQFRIEGGRQYEFIFTVNPL